MIYTYPMLVSYYPIGYSMLLARFMKVGSLLKKCKNLFLEKRCYFILRKIFENVENYTWLGSIFLNITWLNMGIFQSKGYRRIKNYKF